jgi:L-aminopeptidase/D-esterase-like protein
VISEVPPRSFVAAAIVAVCFAEISGQLPSRLAPSNSTLTLIPGIRVGHRTLSARPTGCTVVLTDGGATGGIAQRGAAPGTRETSLARLVHQAETIDAIVLAGGSAFGLDAADGVVRWLDERAGSRPRTPRIPIVPAAVLIDLWVGNQPSVRPDAECGYQAAASASTAPVEEGTVGAGAGATVGKLAGLDRAMKGGIGSSAVTLPNGLQVAALVAVNPLGDVVDPQSGVVLAGARNDDGSLADARKLMRSGVAVQRRRSGENTTIGVVATNARLTKVEANRMAAMADDGYARAIVPVHTLADGDTVFTLATGAWNGSTDITTIGGLAAEVVADAVVRAVTQAKSAAGVPSARDLKK